MHEIIKKILDHHYFQNALYGMKGENYVLDAFKQDRLNEFIVSCIYGKRIKEIDVKDLESLIEGMGNLSEDICKFLLNYAYKIEFMHKNLSKENFNHFIDMAYDKYLEFANKCDAK